jgi:hypothetical protein
MGEQTTQEAYEEGFYDARASVLVLIDEWYAEYKSQLDNLPLSISIGFLKKAIIDADVMDADE